MTNGTPDLAVSGPNGFQHEVKGTMAGAAAAVDATVTKGRERDP